MKLILCTNCDDVIKLIPLSWRVCKCGKCGGRYLDDGLQAEYYGNKAIRVCFLNPSLLQAILAGNNCKEKKRLDFEAFTLCGPHESFVKVKRP